VAGRNAADDFAQVLGERVSSHFFIGFFRIRA
jgi:hypothetical protein